MDPDDFIKKLMNRTSPNVMPTKDIYTNRGPKTTFDFYGRKFGRLTAGPIIDHIGGAALVQCKCECGNDFVVRLTSLRSGATKSCGCLRMARGATGMSQGTADAFSRTFAKLRGTTQRPSTTQSRTVESIDPLPLTPEAERSSTTKSESELPPDDLSLLVDNCLRIGMDASVLTPDQIDTLKVAAGMGIHSLSAFAAFQPLPPKIKRGRGRPRKNQ
ncbi:AP2 domain-containing protein [Biomphalaria pfeifferi]|uniref:AP2 domain-containing protein n=1 Tax=Biomphalaria pfeifferi TaxID=112525 RepID=A0AAD8ANF6_BIOPF|nr:AP2 domain-containing protein [Biomphalaria pfeifferi]